jgi:hypothetical protein
MYDPIQNSETLPQTATYKLGNHNDDKILSTQIVTVFIIYQKLIAIDDTFSKLK